MIEQEKVHSNGKTEKFLDSIVIYDPTGHKVCEVPFKDLKSLHYNKRDRQIVVRTEQATMKYRTTG